MGREKDSSEDNDGVSQRVLVCRGGLTNIRFDLLVCMGYRTSHSHNLLYIIFCIIFGRQEPVMFHLPGLYTNNDERPFSLYKERFCLKFR